MIRQITSQELDNFLSKQKYSQFLQSSSWNNFENKNNHNVWQIGIFDKLNSESEVLLGVASIVEKKLILNYSYLYCPRGPIFSDLLDNEQKNEYLRLILKSIRDLTIETKKYKETFFRFEPIFQLEMLECVVKTKDFQPSNTLLIDLRKSQEELRLEMHQKTRYNINLAQKKGVVVEKSDDIEKFLFLIRQTSKRGKFVSHSEEYYRKILETSAGNACLWIARHNDNILAANIVMAFGDTVTYTHGASSDEFRNFMAPHLLQWEQIKWAKENNYDFYDFWGISEDKNSPWAGFTRFKKGFGGSTKTMPGTFDLVFDKNVYSLYSIYKKLRKMI